MRHTLKWSFFIGTAIAGAVLTLLKIFQPVRYEHLVLFGYAFVGSSVAAGYVVHKNLEKRNSKSQSIAKEDDGKNNTQNYPEALGSGANNFFAVVKRVSVGNMEEKAENIEPICEKQDSASVPDFVPASSLVGNESDDPEPPRQENEKIAGCNDAENFLNEVEREEVEKEMHKAEINAEGNLQPMPIDTADRFLKYHGRRAKVFTKDNKIISGRFAGMDTHAVLENAECGPERKSIMMVSKSEIARMEIE